MDSNLSSLPAEGRRLNFSALIAPKSIYWVASILAAFTLLAYQSVFSHNFQTHWDDQWVVFNFYTENGLTAHNLYEIFTQFYRGQYSPINQLSFTLLYAAAGSNYNPFWFHTYSVLLHIINVVLVYVFIKKLLQQSQAFTQNSILNIAFCTALIMSIHPFLVEPVAWMAASKILLYSFFYLLALIFYLDYLRTDRKWYLAVIALLYTLSFGSKEQAVTLPACLILLDYVLKRDLKKRSVWIEKIPFILLSLAFAYITLLSQKAYGVGLLTHNRYYPFYQNVIFGSYALTEYFVKCVIPIKLSFLYTFPNAIGQPVPLRFWMYPPILVVILVTLRDFWKQKWMFFSLAFFIIHLAITLHIVPIARMAIVADRYAYIASIAAFFSLAYFLDQIINSVKYRTTGIALFVVYISYLTLYTYNHAKVWRDSDTLKKEVLDEVKKQDELEQKSKNNDTN